MKMKMKIKLFFVMVWHLLKLKKEARKKLFEQLKIDIQSLNLN